MTLYDEVLELLLNAEANGYPQWNEPIQCVVNDLLDYSDIEGSNDELYSIVRQINEIYRSNLR